jgi:DNA polymerase-1
LKTTIGDNLAASHSQVFQIILEAKLTGTISGEYDKDTLNLNSVAQLKKLLFDDFKIIPSQIKTTPKGNVSLDKEALQYIDHPIAKAIIEYKKYYKLQTAFINSLPGHIVKNRIHAEYNATGTVTGRFSVSNPNMQQVPAHTDLGKQLRNCFIAGRGKKFVVADYSAMELRVLAHYSRDKTLLDAFKNNKDPHLMTAKKIFNKDVDKKSEERQIAKMVNFGVVYGISSMGLQRRLRALGINKTEGECQHFINLYFQSHPGVKNFLDEVRHVIINRGYVKTLYGRRRRLDGRSGREIRQAGNFVIQGSSADLIKQAMIDIHAELPANARIVAMIHDELVVECKEKDAEKVKDIIKRCMETPKKKLFVPITVDEHIVDRWGDSK